MAVPCRVVPDPSEPEGDRSRSFTRSTDFGLSESWPQLYCAVLPPSDRGEMSLDTGGSKVTMNMHFLPVL